MYLLCCVLRREDCGGVKVKRRSNKNYALGWKVGWEKRVESGMD